MRHKYETRALVLSRSAVGEASAFVVLLTPELGLVRALTQGVRKSGAKLAHALTTFAESEVVLVRGKEGWRLAGAVLDKNWFMAMPDALARTRAARVVGLLLRLVAGEAHQESLFGITAELFTALTQLPPDRHEAVEILAALRILSVLGFDAGSDLGEPTDFTPERLQLVGENRLAYIARINHGIEASGL